MKPKPEHLGPEYAAQFGDRSVASSYHTRPPYPSELFAQLLRLVPEDERTVLDLGCGTGDVAMGLVGRVDRIDAVDASAPMLEVASTRHRSGIDGLHWVHATAEAFQTIRHYGLVVAGESLQWMEWEVVFGWLPAALVEEGVLALVSGREFTRVPWQTELGELIARFSTNQRYRPYDLVAELKERRLFDETGRYSTPPVDYAQSLGDYVESIHTRNGFSRERMSPAAAASFDDALVEMAKRQCPDGLVHGQTVATVVWGVPRRPTKG